MSVRTALRLALVALLAVAFASPAVAQEGGFTTPLGVSSGPVEIVILSQNRVHQAPMPREKPSIEIEFGIELGGVPQLFGRGPVGFDFGTPVAPMPRAKTSVSFSTHDNHFWWDEPIEGIDFPAQAPMPRVKKQNRIEIELRFGTPSGLELKWTHDGAPVCSAPHEGAIQPPCCGPDCCRKPVTTAPMAQPARPIQLAFGSDHNLSWQPVPPAPPQFLMAQPAPPCVAQGSFITGGLGSARPAQRVIPTVAVSPLTCGPMPTSRPAPTPAFGVQVIEVMGFDMGMPCPFPQAAPNPLIGTWHRDIGIANIAVTFTHDEMKLCITQSEDGVTGTLTITAHYTLTKDGLVYGSITSADVALKSKDKMTRELTKELAELSVIGQQLADQPFSFRVKSTSAGLMVSQVKAIPFEGINQKELAVLGGLYKHAKADCTFTVTLAQPACVTKCDVGGATGITVGAACAKPATGAVIGGLTGTATGVLIGNERNFDMMPPKPVTIERVGIDFNTNPPTMSHPLPPMPVAQPCPTMPQSQPIKPVGCGIPNDPMKQMAAEAFGQLLQSSDAMRNRGMTLPSPQYLQHYPQYFSPDAAHLLPRVLASQEIPRCEACPVAASAPKKPGIVGTWYRDFGSKRCVATVAADHMTFTVSETHEMEGKPVTAHLTFTVEYQLTRDGTTVVGLLTSVDAKFDGDLPEHDTEEMTEKLAEIQKLLEDKPFAMTIRVYGNALVIGNVRMPSVGGRMEADPATYIGGRYTTVGDKPLPKLKTAKARDPLPAYGPMPSPYAGSVPPSVYDVPLGQPGQLLPPGSGYPMPTPGAIYPMPGVVYPAPVPSAVCPAPSGNLIPPQAIAPPAPRVRVIDASLPTMTTPTPSVPAMPQPVPPLGNNSLMRTLEKSADSTQPDNRQLFNFGLGVFGSQ